MTTIHRAANVNSIEDRNGLTVRVLGDITTRNAQDVCDAVQEEWEEHERPNRLTLDLHEVPHLDSSGAGALMEMQQRATRWNTRLTICGLQDGPRRLLERTGVGRLFEIRERAADTAPLLPPSRATRERADEPPKRKRIHRALWALLWLCVIAGGLVAIGITAYPTLENYHARLEQVPVLRDLLGAVDKRVIAVEQGIKDQFVSFEARLNRHQTLERRQRQQIQAEMNRRTADLNARMDALDAAQRTTDARVNDLQQQIEQTK